MCLVLEHILNFNNYGFLVNQLKIKEGIRPASIDDISAIK